MKSHSNITNSASVSEAKRWDVYEFGVAESTRSQLISYARFKFPSIPIYELEEIVARVVDRAADPPGLPGAYDDDAFNDNKVFTHLRTCTINACRNWCVVDHRANIKDLEAVAGAEGSDGEIAVKLGEILGDAEEHLDPNTWAYVQMNVAGFERGDMQFSRRQIERMRAKWSAWSVEAKRRVGALLPLPAFVRRWLEGGGGVAAAGAGGAALSTKVAASCAAAAVCAAGVFGISKSFDSAPSQSEAAKSSIAAPVVRETAPLPTQKLSDNERKDTKKRDAHTRRKARTEGGSPAEREFGVEQTATNQSASPAPAAPSGDDCSDSTAGEFSVDC